MIKPVIVELTIKKILQIVQFRKNYLKGQRPQYLDHVEKIYNSMKNSIENDSFKELNPIHIAYTLNEEFGKEEFDTSFNFDDCWLIDGQHRLRAYLELVKNNYLTAEHIIICFFHKVKNENEKNILFDLINTNEPYRKIEINKRELIRLLTEKVNTRFPDAIKNQKSVQRPRILQTDWEKGAKMFIKYNPGKNEEELFSKLIDINEILKERFLDDETTTRKLIANCEKIKYFSLGAYTKEWYKIESDTVNKDNQDIISSEED